MWFEKFLDVINRLLPLDPIKGHEEALSQLDPEKTYIENVRSLLGVTHAKALSVCETAVRQGFFERRLEVLCPDRTAALSVSNEEDVPPVITCTQMERGHFEEVELPTDNLRRILFYRLNGD